MIPLFFEIKRNRQPGAVDKINPAGDVGICPDVSFTVNFWFSGEHYENTGR